MTPFILLLILRLTDVHASLLLMASRASNRSQLVSPIVSSLNETPAVLHVSRLEAVGVVPRGRGVPPSSAKPYQRRLFEGKRPVQTLDSPFP